MMIAFGRHVAHAGLCGLSLCLDSQQAGLRGDCDVAEPCIDHRAKVLKKLGPCCGTFFLVISIPIHSTFGRR